MSTFIDVLRSQETEVNAEIQRLSQEVLRAQQRLKVATDKIDHIHALLSLFEAEQEQSAAANVYTVDVAPIMGGGGVFAHVVRIPHHGRRNASKTMAIKNETIAILNEEPIVHRSAILGRLISKGIMGTEKDPMAQLAAFLSDNRDQFASDGRGNFSLRLNGHTEPQPADTESEAGNVGVDEAARTAPPVTDHQYERTDSWAGSPATD